MSNKRRRRFVKRENPAAENDEKNLMDIEDGDDIAEGTQIFEDGDDSEEEALGLEDIDDSEEEALDFEDTDEYEDEMEENDIDEMPEEKESESFLSDSEERPRSRHVRRRYRARMRKVNRLKKERKPVSRKPFIIAGCIVGVLLVIYLGVAAFFMSHFLINTTINGKDFSGKTTAAVEKYLKEQVKGYKLTVLEQNNVSDSISGSDISLEYKKTDDLQKALKNQKQLLWIVSLFSKSSEDVNVSVDYDEKALEEKIQTLQAVTAEQTQPVSAHPEFDGNSFVVAKETVGTAVDMDTLTSKVKEYITEFKPQLNLEDEGCYVQPKYTSESAEVQQACDTMNQYIKASITYPMTEDVVVDKTLISQWLTCDDNMQVVFNEDAVKAWMKDFGSKYDTKGKTRSITSPAGETVNVSGGTYGWVIDEATETTNLINSIKNGEVTKRDPAYKQTAATHSAQDWGTTYIEVDISSQHMWYIKDGSIAMESDVVTGLPNGERDTPKGVYYIIYTQKDRVLKGEKDPATGKPSYETPVAFWMPFTNQGHGFHDATWQSSFGGSRYLTHGSHGCVNMPYSQAQQLFGMISSGTPVIIHD